MPVPTRAPRCLIPTLALIAAPLVAQDVTGGLVGRVVGASLQPVPDVQITIAGPGLQGDRRLWTNGDGYFRALDLPPGSYTNVGLPDSKPK